MKMKLLSMLLIVILFVQAFVVQEAFSQDDPPEGSNGGVLMKRHPRIINCTYACGRRCSKSSRKNLCHRACKSCCARCHCVPPGTYGNKNLCPCYAKLKTHGNRPKCP